MTRKQAIRLAIDLLRGKDQNETADILTKLSDELPFYRWSEEAMFDAVEQFILDHGRIPTVTDFKRKELPPHPVVKRRFGMDVSEWMDRYYPDDDKSGAKRRAKATEMFVQEYLRIRPVSSLDFNARRGPTCCCWSTIALYNNTRRWTALVEILGLPVFKRERAFVPRPEYLPELKVNIINNYDFRDDD